MPTSPWKVMPQLADGREYQPVGVPEGAHLVPRQLIGHGPVADVLALFVAVAKHISDRQREEQTRSLAIVDRHLQLGAVIARFGLSHAAPSSAMARMSAATDAIISAQSLIRKVSMPPASIRQVKAARALLGWSQTELASRSGISEPTIKRLEAIDSHERMGGRPETGEAIHAPSNPPASSSWPRMALDRGCG